MSRTKRIYNSDHWRWHAEGKINGAFMSKKYRDWAYERFLEDTDLYGSFLFSDVFITEDDLLDMAIDWYLPYIYGWPTMYGFEYHKYKNLCMGCGCCESGKFKENRHRRRVLRRIEREELELYYQEFN